MKQSTADKLMKLHHEMVTYDYIHRRFNQDTCQSCVIGYGISVGAINGFTKNTIPQYTQAVKYIFKDEDNYDCANKYETYLFGGSSSVRMAADDLDLSFSESNIRDKRLTPNDAIIRIEAVLDREGYDIQ